MNDTMTAKEVRDRFGIASSTLARWKQAGKILHVGPNQYTLPNEDRPPQPGPKSADPTPRAHSPIVDAGEYTFVEDRDLYVFHHMPGERRASAIPRRKIEEIVASYSDLGGGSTVNQIARAHNLSRAQVVYILRALGKTHDSAPFTDEQIATGCERELADDIVRSKENRILVRAQRVEWKRIVEDAERWRLFDEHVLPRLSGIKVAPPSTHEAPESFGEYDLIATPTDAHIGSAHLDIDTHTHAISASWRAMLDRTIAMRGAPDRIVMGIGSDWMHIDTPQATTTRGTQMQTQSEYGTLLAVAAGIAGVCLRDASIRARSVDLVLMAGNHDRASAHAIFLVLNAMAQLGTMKNVVVHTPYSARGYNGREYVRTKRGLYGFAHGDRARKDLGRLMAQERPSDWGEAKERAWFTGHLHHERVVDDYGVRVFQLPALTTQDQWHREEGYVGAHAGVTGVIYGDSGYEGTVFQPLEIGR